MKIFVEAGVVFSHGTNSLEETLFLGDLLINCGKRESAVYASLPLEGMRKVDNA
jgi:hypothetical protein